MDKAILVCREPRAAHWQLGNMPLIGELTLLGWRCPFALVDAGVPEVIATITAGALTATSRVVFACSDSPCPTKEGWVQGEAGDWLCASGNGAGRFKALWRREPINPVLLATHRSETAIKLFNDPVYPWWLQGQLALLCAAEAPLPVAGSIEWATLLEDDWISRAATLGVQGAVRPGVDGDIAGVWFRSSILVTHFLDELEARTYAAGFTWQVLPEEAFAQKLTTD